MTASERLGIRGMPPEHVRLMIPEFWDQARVKVLEAIRGTEFANATDTELDYATAHLAQRLFNRAMGEE